MIFWTQKWNQKQRQVYEQKLQKKGQGLDGFDDVHAFENILDKYD